MILLKIFFFLFSVFIFPDSISKSEFRILKKEIDEDYKNQKFSVLIPKLEKIILYSEEPKYKLLLGLSYFNRDDLEIPVVKDEIFIRNRKIQVLKKNYELSKKYILEYLKFIEERNLIKKEPQISEYYFILSIIEYQLNNHKNSENYLKQSLKLGFPKKDLIYFNSEFIKN